MQWIDFVVLALLASTIYCGWKKGFFVTAIELLKWVASLIVARLFYKPFTEYVIKNVFDPTVRVSKHVRNYLNDFFQFDPLVNQSLTADQTNEALKSLTLPEQFMNALRENISEKVITHTIDFVDTLTQSITELIVYGIGFVVLLLLLLIAFGLFQWFGSILSKLPIFKELNQGGGVIIGAILGVTIVYAVMAAISFFPTFGWSSYLIDQIEQSQVAIYFYKYNILKYAFQSILMQGIV